MFILSSPCHGSQWLWSVLCCSCAVLGNVDLLLFQRVLDVSILQQMLKVSIRNQMLDVLTTCFKMELSNKSGETTAKVSPPTCWWQLSNCTKHFLRRCHWDPQNIPSKHQTSGDVWMSTGLFLTLDISWYIPCSFLSWLLQNHFFSICLHFSRQKAVSTWSRSNFETMPCHAPQHHTSRQLSERFMRSLRKKGMQRTQVDALFSYMIYVCLLKYI